MGGIVRTRVGYSGGNRANPTYNNIGDHTETIRIEYDPAKLSYRKLLDIFWRSHDPFSKSHSRQYKTAVFCHNDEQWKLASETRSELETNGKKVHTEILSAGKFYAAEDYHQKYRLRRHEELLKEYEAIYPENWEFNFSTAVARVNGYLAGYGTAESLGNIIDKLGLTDNAKEVLRKIVKASSRQ
jgi:methionine-S-sulfoxide reductase